jgi:polyferredoxin
MLFTAAVSLTRSRVFFLRECVWSRDMMSRRSVSHILLLLFVVLLFPALRPLKGTLVNHIVDLALPLLVLAAGLYLACGAVFPIQGCRGCETRITLCGQPVAI